MIRAILLALSLGALSACIPLGVSSGSYTDSITVQPGRWWFKSRSFSGSLQASARFSVQGGTVNAYFLSESEFARFKAGSPWPTIRLISSAQNAASGQVGGTVHSGTYVLAFYNGSSGPVTIVYTGSIQPLGAK